MKVRLDALDHCVTELRRNYGDLLVMRKSPFSAASPVRMTGVTDQSRRLNALEQLDVAAAEIENRAIHALPVEEREARFHSIRGLRPAPDTPQYQAAIDQARAANPRYATSTLVAYTFAPTSRDTRIREGEFTLGFRNEVNPYDPAGEPLDLHAPWKDQVGPDGLDRDEATARVVADGFDAGLAYVPLSVLLQVEVALLEASADPPFAVLAYKSPGFFRFAMRQGLINPELPFVIDPLHEDFSSEQITKVLRAIGNMPATARRRR